jgi:hypothetical protein
MKYEKPEVVVLGSALAAIQSGSPEKPGDDFDSPVNNTTSAYEADE